MTKTTIPHPRSHPLLQKRTGKKATVKMPPATKSLATTLPYGTNQRPPAKRMNLSSRVLKKQTRRSLPVVRPPHRTCLPVLDTILVGQSSEESIALTQPSPWFKTLSQQMGLQSPQEDEDVSTLAQDVPSSPLTQGRGKSSPRFRV